MISKRIFLWLSLFAIAMAYLESAVVVYLRHLLYPEGFDFPLAPISKDLVVTELWREFATIIMLLGAGIITGRNRIERFALFIYCFAVWDIFYYVFLKALLDWPASFLTWDVLFLIPVTWTGPVITPILVSTLMIALAFELVYLKSSNNDFKPSVLDWFILILASFIIITSFCWDYAVFILDKYSVSEWWSISENALFDLGEQYIPTSFNWPLWSFGMALILMDMLLMWKRRRSYSD